MREGKKRTLTDSVLLKIFGSVSNEAFKVEIFMMVGHNSVIHGGTTYLNTELVPSSVVGTKVPSGTRQGVLGAF